MENSKWKLGAKIVAYFDLITSIIELFFLGLGALLLLTGNYELQIEGEGSATDGVPGFFLWLIYALGIINVCIELWASIQLLQAVKEGADKDVALRKAKIWRNVHIVLLSIKIIGLVCFLQVIGMLVVFVRGILMFIVWKFIEILKYEKSTLLQAAVDVRTSIEEGIPHELLRV